MRDDDVFGWGRGETLPDLGLERLFARHGLTGQVVRFKPGDRAAYYVPPLDSAETAAYLAAHAGEPDDYDPDGRTIAISWAC